MSISLQDFHRMVGGLAHEFEATGLHPSQYHLWAIKRMNTMYSLPINTTPSLENLGESPVKRMAGFLKTLRAEMDEGLEILSMLMIREMRDDGVDVTPEIVYQVVQSVGLSDPQRVEKTLKEIHSLLGEDREEYSKEVLVSIADWLGDMKVYIDSESLKYGIMLSPVLACIMGSNFTKLNERGEVVKDENGKVQKGPNFEPPEKAIRAVLFGAQELMDEAGEINARVNAVNTVAVSVALANPDMEVFAEAPSDAFQMSYPDNYREQEALAPAAEVVVQSSPLKKSDSDKNLFPE